MVLEVAHGYPALKRADDRVYIQEEIESYSVFVGREHEPSVKISTRDIFDSSKAKAIWVLMELRQGDVSDLLVTDFFTESPRDACQEAHDRAFRYAKAVIGEGQAALSLPVDQRKPNQVIPTKIIDNSRFLTERQRDDLVEYSGAVGFTL